MICSSKGEVEYATILVGISARLLFYVTSRLTSAAYYYYNFIRYGLPYGAIFILCALLLPEPTYMGPEYVTYFRGLQSLEEELQRNKSTTWVLCLYAAWHPACVNFAPTYAEISATYSLDNLKFGKLDVGRYPEASAKYRIQDGPTSRQLPTVVLLQDGQEKMRRPTPDHSGKLQKFLFSKENMKTAFNLEGLHAECKAKLSAAKAEKKTAKKKQ